MHYFEVDGYYVKNDPEHRKASRWHGEAADLLGLHGRVNPKRFEAVLAGYVPGTELRLGRLRDGEHQHRPGVDVTFSAPKSVSLEALVYAPPKTRARVVRAHDEAVRATLGFIETELLQTRSYEPETGRRPRVQADGMVAATFRHLASRNLDPQLHTHAVIANMTRGRDGDWRSAEFTAVERSKLLIGAYYRNELRTRLKKIGYATVPTLVGRMPGFEIAGYQRPMLDAFSTRRRELLDYMQERGWENTPARTQQAALYTRRRKAEPDRQVLQETWQVRAREIGPARDRNMARGRKVVHVSASAAPQSRELPSALSVVRRAVEHLEERRTVFAANDLRAWALAHGAGRHSLEALDAGIAQLRRDGHLIEVTARRADLAFVTDRARNAERDIIAGMRSGMDAGHSLAPEGAVEARLDVNGGGNMYRGGGAKMMEWTPPPDGICMCQGGVVVRPPEGGGIRGTGYHRRDRFGEAQLSASWCWGGRLCRVPQEAEPGEIAGLSRFSAALRGRDGGLRGRSPMGPRDRRARPRGEVAPAGLRQAVREAA